MTNRQYGPPNEPFVVVVTYTDDGGTLQTIEEPFSSAVKAQHLQRIAMLTGAVTAEVEYRPLRTAEPAHREWDDPDRRDAIENVLDDYREGRRL